MCREGEKTWATSVDGKGDDAYPLTSLPNPESDHRPAWTFPSSSLDSSTPPAFMSAKNPMRSQSNNPGAPTSMSYQGSQGVWALDCVRAVFHDLEEDHCL